VPAPVAPIPDADPENSWVVQPGESFWSIAADHLSDIGGHDISEREVGSYWRQLIELNRSRLVDPFDADLLFTGQVLELPTVAPG
jgi:nucleoid-associated protein YgaU